MKKLIITVLICLFSLNMAAQKSDTTQVTTAYLSATNVNYVMIDNGDGFKKHKEYKSTAIFFTYLANNANIIEIVSFQFMNQPFLMVIYVRNVTILHNIK